MKKNNVELLKKCNDKKEKTTNEEEMSFKIKKWKSKLVWPLLCVCSEIIRREHQAPANEGPVRIQYKCLVPIYVFPEMKLHGPVNSKQKYNALSSNFHIHVSGKI